MSDGRNFAKWQPGAAINKEIRDKNKIKTNWEYRQYLTQQADEIIKSNQLEACDQCGDCPINSTTDYSTTSANTPFLYKNCIDKSQPYGYNDSDLKNLYLSRNELQCRMVAPILSQDQYLQQNYPNPN
tara:strand:- start:637 stop:1020 length:384 start_codon:yes stop_codon:yes gene_type:complete